MSTFVDTKMLKSQYISILGLYILPISPVSLVPQRFQRVCQGAHHLLVNMYLAACQVAKVLICSCLGIFVSIYAGIGGRYRHSLRPFPVNRRQHHAAFYGRFKTFGMHRSFQHLHQGDRAGQELGRVPLHSFP